MQAIQLRGVRTRNLRGFDVSFRLGTWTNVLGVSGSGKTSLCFHTLHALAQHWFLSAMAPAARMLLEEIPHPVLDAAHGLIPTLALEQGQERIGPRMRAMDVAGVDLPLRSLMVACGQAVSPVTGQVLRSWIPAEIADWLIEHCLGVKVQALFPVGKHTAGYWMQRGFTRAVVAGDACELEDPSRELAASDWIVVDRLVAEGKYRQRLGEAMGLCLASGGGRGAVLVMEVTGSRIVEFSDHPRCPESDREVPRATMGALSPNSVQGACPDCAGTGLVEERPCPGCDGHGLGEASRWVRLGGLSMPDMLALSFREMSAWLASSGLLEHPQEAIRQTASELAGRFDCLDRLGLGYLQIGRKAHALSFGEHHRLKLALLTGYPLSGVCYVLDEPSTGLHPSDASRMQEHLKALVGAGNTLVVVEHRLRDLAGDRVVEIGPGPGGEGGDLVFNGDLTEFVKSDSPSAILGRRSLSPSGPVPREFLRLEGATGRNLKGAGLDVALGGVTGV
ncbi:MAG: UvrABC system protein, partial [Fibrobacterota bacterium]